MSITVPARLVPAPFTGSPGRLRLVGLAAAAAALAVGLLGGWVLDLRVQFLDDARAGTDQIVRLQTVRTSLARADADATRGFLTAGTDPADLRADYADSLDTATTTLAQAAAAEPDDATALATVSSGTATYAGLVEQARANDRQGYPVGAAYLRQASSQLRGTVLPALDEALAADVARVASAYRWADAVTYGGAVVVVLLVAGLIRAQHWLAHRVHRVFNVPAAWATAAVLLVLLVSTADTAVVTMRLDQVRSGPYAATLALSNADIALYDAASNESLALINRGSGSSYHQTVQDDIDAAAGYLDTAVAAGADASLVDRLDAWSDVHAQVLSLDQAGEWDDAVALATGDADDSSPVVFSALADDLDSAIADRSALARDSATAVRPWLALASVLCLVTGIAAALGVWAGFAQRLQEYR